MHYFVDGTLLIYEGIREHVKQVFYLMKNISKISLLNLFLIMSYFVAIHSLPGRILHMPFFTVLCLQKQLDNSNKKKWSK